MDLRGIYMSAEKPEVVKYADSLVKVTDQISAVIADWQRGVRNNDALAFSNFAVRINDYQDSLYKLAPIAAAVTEQGAATQEIARGVEVAAGRTVAIVKEVNLMGATTRVRRQ